MGNGKTMVPRFLVRTEVVLIVLTLVLSLTMIASYDLLPALGYGIGWKNRGVSMLPEFRDAVQVWADPSRAPFDEVKVGDVIVFRERKDASVGSYSVTINNTKGSIDGMGSEPTNSQAEMSEPADSQAEVSEPTEPADEGYVDEGIDYFKSQRVMHRVVRIDETLDRALFTRGDNNPVDDLKPVMESVYIGTVVWHANGITLLTGWLFHDHGYSLIVAATLLLGLVLIILRLKGSPAEGDATADEVE